MKISVESKYIKFLKLLFFSLVLFLVLVGAGSSYYGITALKYVEQSARILGSSVTYHLYKEDLISAEKVARTYQIGYLNVTDSDPYNTWSKHDEEGVGFVFHSYKGARVTDLEIPFIFENSDAEYLKAIRNRYNFDALIDDHEINEYESMLRVAAWVGSLWDHGTDEVPGGSKRFKLTDAIDSAKKGSAFWCEVSARAFSQVAASLGWPSRVLSLSSTGYEWEHAVTELWSNQFSKWFVVDTDFNIVYEVNDIPLSAYEIIHSRSELIASGELEVRKIAPMKPFFLSRYGEKKELSILRELEVYKYAHIDMRNDWVSRSLRSGSPAGGDLATYYTVNENFGSIYNAYHRVKSKSEFNWPVNTVEVFLNEWGFEGGKGRLNLTITAYAPYIEYIEMQTNRDGWIEVEPGSHSLSLPRGEYTLSFRVKSKNSMPGPITNISFSILGT